jgi:cytochrome c5
VSASEEQTFSTHNITVLGGLLLIALIIGEVVIGPQSDEEPMAEVVDTVMTLASAAGGAADQSPDQLYQSACLACHTTGAAGAPKIGFAAEWTERLAKGLDGLVTSAINGIGAMVIR